MLAFLFWLMIFCISNTISITLVGERALISGNLLNVYNLFKLVTHWKFILAMLFALFSRLSFVMINNALLKLPKLATASTTITTFATLISLVFVVIANYYYLGERFSFQQLAGAAVIVIGVILMVK